MVDTILTSLLVLAVYGLTTAGVYGLQRCYRKKVFPFNF